MVIRVIFSLSEVQISAGQTLKNGLWKENNSIARETNNADRSLSDRLFNA